MCAAAMAQSTRRTVSDSAYKNTSRTISVGEPGRTLYRQGNTDRTARACRAVLAGQSRQKGNPSRTALALHRVGNGIWFRKNSAE